jgi:hypothetical protein
MTDRAFWLAGGARALNVRRLMYQSLIWSAVLRDDAGRLRPPLDAENLKRLSDPLIHRVRRDPELGRDLLRAQMLVDESKAIQLPRRQSGNSARHRIVRSMRRCVPIMVRHGVRFFQGCPHLAQHNAAPEQRVLTALGHSQSFRQNFSGFPPKWVNRH